MQQFRVPTVEVATEIRYFDERLLAGRIFVPANALRHDGPTEPGEWINQGGMFFPFLETGHEDARLLNKRYVVVLTITEETGAERPIGHQRRIRVECGTLSFEGLVFIDLPDNQARLLDWMNRPEAFLTIHDDGRIHIVQKSRITQLIELVDEP